MRRVAVLVLTLAGLTLPAPAEARTAEEALEKEVARLSGEGGRNGLVAGQSYDDQGPRLALLDPDTGRVELVPRGDYWQPYGNAGAADWTPDGTRITVVDWSPQDGTERILDINPTTGEADLVWAVPTTIDIDTISWGPLGDQLAVSYRERSEADGNPVVAQGLAVLTPGTGSFVQLVEGQVASVDFSPTGDRIAYTEYPGTGQNWNRPLAHVIDVDGTDEQVLTQDGFSAFTPDWAPDGERFTVSQVEHLNTGDFAELRVINADTGANRKVSILQGNYSHTIWSPDGTGILYYYGEGGFSSRPPEIGVRYLGTNQAETLYTGTGFVPLAWGTDPGCLLDETPRAARDTGAADDGTVEIGAWVAQGCFTSARGVRRTRDAMRLSGLTLTPVKGSIQLDKDHQRLTSTGPVDVTIEGSAGGLKLGPVVLQKGERLDWDLGATTLPAFAVEHFLDIPVLKPLVVRATTGGTSQIRAALRIPFLGEQQSPPLTLTNETGLAPDALDWKVDSVQVTDFVRLGEVRIRYDVLTRTWEPTATLAGAGPTVDLGFRAKDGRIQDAHLRVPSLDLAGMVRLTDLAVTYNRSRSDDKAELETYDVTATSPVDGGQVDTFTGSVVYREGALTRFAFGAQTAHYFGVVKVRSFDLEWSAEDGWSGGAEAALRPGDPLGAGLNVGVSIRSVKHRIVAASVTAPVVRMGIHEQGFELHNLEIAWSQEPAPGGGTHDVWTGGAKLVWPGAEDGATAVSGRLRFEDGAFVSGSIAGDNITLAPGLVLPRVQADLALAPLSIKGSGTLRLGPEIPVLGAATASVTAAYTAAAQLGDPDTYEFRGDLSLGSGELAEAVVTYRTDGTLMAQGTFGWRLGNLAVAQGAVRGTVDASGYRLQGEALVSAGTAQMSGSARVTQVGIAACVGLAGTPVSVGFGYRWGGQVNRLAAACDLGRFLAPARGTFRLRRGAASLDVGAGEEVLALEVAGAGGAPSGMLRGPDGTAVDLGDAEGVSGGRFLHRDPETRTTYVAVASPAPGTWTIEPGNGPDVVGVRSAQALPEAEVTATVVPTAGGFALTHQVDQVEGQRIVVSEVVDGQEHELASFSASGTTDVEPLPGPAGPRALVATVLQDGLVRTTLDLGTYDAPHVTGCTAATRCPTTTTARAKPQGRRLQVSGRVAPPEVGTVVVALTRRGRVTTRLVDLAEGTFRVALRRRADPVRCRVTVLFPGSDTHVGSADSLRARC